MNARCRLLAYAVTPTTYRCPTTSTTFHWHAYDPSVPYSILVDGRPCTHMHRSQDAANRCVVKNATPRT